MFSNKCIWSLNGHCYYYNILYSQTGIENVQVQYKTQKGQFLNKFICQVDFQEHNIN